MSSTYDLNAFTIDMMLEVHKTRNPFNICMHAKLDMDVQLTVMEILLYMKNKDIKVSSNYSVQMNEIFQDE